MTSKVSRYVRGLACKVLGHKATIAGYNRIVRGSAVVYVDRHCCERCKLTWLSAEILERGKS